MYDFCTEYDFLYDTIASRPGLIWPALAQAPSSTCLKLKFDTRIHRHKQRPTRVSAQRRYSTPNLISRKSVPGQAERKLGPGLADEAVTADDESDIVNWTTPQQSSVVRLRAATLEGRHHDATHCKSHQSS